MQILLSSVSFGYMIQTCPARPPHPPSLAGLGSQSIFTQIVQIYATCSIKTLQFVIIHFLLSLWLWKPCRQTFTPCWVVVLPWCGCGCPTHLPHLDVTHPPVQPTITNLHPNLWLHIIPTSSLPYHTHLQKCTPPEECINLPTYSYHLVSTGGWVAQW